MTTETKTNYTETQTTELVQAYLAGKPVEQIAETLGKSVRSVVAKLSREGVYRAKTRVSQHRVKKADLVEQLAKACGVAPEVFESLEKANHDVLEALAARIGA